MLIGLIGKSGSGKTTVSLLFKELNKNIYVLEIDKIGHKSYTDESVRTKMFQYFGDEIFNSDSSINRKKVASIVFNDTNMMQKLYDATYEFMQKEIDKVIQEHDIVILDYALLPLTKYYDMCDIKILVTSDYSSRCQRVITRDNISKEKYAERDANSVDYSNIYFDYIIHNNSDITNLRKVIGDIYEKSIIPGKF